MTNKTSKIIFPILVLISFLTLGNAYKCGPDKFSYGQNEIIDQLLICSLGKAFDLDMTPHGDLVKSTARSLVDQGLSNKTSIIYSKLTGTWSAKRPEFVESGWKCEHDKSILTAMIELKGISSEIIEKVDTLLHKNQHKLASSKPCKTFELPLWMCRQSKPIYKTIKTWVNSAYFNLTLVQLAVEERPRIDRLKLMFTCPETFKQKITHSPSTMYAFSKYFGIGSSGEHQDNSVQSFSIRNPATFGSTQDGKSPVSPTYRSTVNLIINAIESMLRSNIQDCLETIDSDLSLVADHNSFSDRKFIKLLNTNERSSMNGSFINECSNRLWIKNRIELAHEADRLDIQNGQGSYYTNSWTQA